MTLAHRLYGQFRQLIHEGAKFLVVGGIGLVVTNLVYGLMRHFGVGPISATTIATVVATAVTYVGNRYWSFKHRERAGVAREGVLFIALNVVGLLIQDAVVGVNAYVLGFQHGHKVEQLIALNVGIGIATLFRFWSYRKWVWLEPPADAAGEPFPAGLPASGFAGAPVLQANGHANGNGYASGHANGNGHVNGHAVAGNDPTVARRR